MLNVHLTRAFTGSRHMRLETLWDAVAEYWKDIIRIHVHANPSARFSHAQMFRRMWVEEWECDDQYCLFTEFDFLPNLYEPGSYTPAPLFLVASWQNDSPVCALGATYATRKVSSRALQLHDEMMGGWWVMLDKEVCPRNLQFDGTPDPCNQMAERLGAVGLEDGEDCYPAHYGIEYSFGTHLFWSRHLHDPDTARIAGFDIGDVQRKHDAAVDAWIAEAPKAFRQLLKEKYPAVLR